jgi:hypothetical protein
MHAYLGNEAFGELRLLLDDSIRAGRVYNRHLFAAARQCLFKDI